MAVSVCLPLPDTGSHQIQWDYVLSNFAADTVYVVGDEGDAPAANAFAAGRATYLGSPADIPASAGKRVLLAPSHGRYVAGVTDLAGFDHPGDACYVFGGDKSHMTVDDWEPSHTVFVPTDSSDDMWSWVAYGVVVWDRRVKARG